MSTSPAVALTRVVHVNGDLMGARSHTPAICHCVSECLAMGKGIAVLFKSEFGRVDELKAQNVGVGGVAVLDVREGPSNCGSADDNKTSSTGKHQTTMLDFIGHTKSSSDDLASSAKSTGQTAIPTPAASSSTVVSIHTPPTLSMESPLRYVYYLITKPRYFHKPTYNDLRLSLRAMFEHMVAHEVPHVAMPEIGCGLDMLQWPQVEAILKEEMDRAVAGHQVAKSKYDSATLAETSGTTDSAVATERNQAKSLSTPVSLLSTVYHYKPPAGSPAAVGEKRGRKGRGGVGQL